MKQIIKYTIKFYQQHTDSTLQFQLASPGLQLLLGPTTNAAGKGIVGKNIDLGQANERCVHSRPVNLGLIGLPKECQLQHSIFNHRKVGPPRAVATGG